jgi:dimethylhistidine N-methyltransferase
MAKKETFPLNASPRDRRETVKAFAPMLPSSVPQTPHDSFIQLWHPDAQAISREILAGLTQPDAAVSPKYFYNALGSRLFEAICELPEYYPTRTEATIIENYLVQIARSVGRGSTLIDLGAGNCKKASYLFPALLPGQYVPVDISVEFLRDAVERLHQRFPYIRMTGIGMDFSSGLELPAAVRSEKRLFFYPGSSIGNFAPDRALALLRRVHDNCGPDGGLLIGVDLAKDRNVLQAAYDDALGVTAAFNLNLLLHLNALVGTDFRLADWRHSAFFNEEASCMEMYLVARRRTCVRWEEDERCFEENESIHTECSYKYTRAGFLHLLEQAGFDAVRTWSDEQEWFMVCHARTR